MVNSNRYWDVPTGTPYLATQVVLWHLRIATPERTLLSGLLEGRIDEFLDETFWFVRRNIGRSFLCVLQQDEYTGPAEERICSGPTTSAGSCERESCPAAGQSRSRKSRREWRHCRAAVASNRARDSVFSAFGFRTTTTQDSIRAAIAGLSNSAAVYRHGECERHPGPVCAARADGLGSSLFQREDLVHSHLLERI